MKDFKKLDQLLWQAMSSDNEPDDQLNEQIINQIRGKNKMKSINKKRISTAAMVATFIAATSITVFAAWQFMTPKQVAQNMGYEGIAIAFEGEDSIGINQTQISGDYKVTLLGIVSGNNINDLDNSIEGIDSHRTYAVTAIENVDGTPMPDTRDEEYGKESFFVSPFIKGQNPREFNIITMNGAYSDFVEDGIMYRMVECDDIEIFADRGLYLGVTSSLFYDINAYDFDLETGEMIPNADYEGTNILFDLPLDPSVGDYDKAQEYLQTLIDQQTPDSEAIDEQEVDIQTLLAGATLIPESVEEAIVSKDGMVSYGFEGYEVGTALESLFKEGQVGMSDTRFIDEEAGNIIAFSRDTDAVITGMVYKQK